MSELSVSKILILVTNFQDTENIPKKKGKKLISLPTDPVALVRFKLYR